MAMPARCSSSVSVNTLKTLPLKLSLDEITLALPARFTPVAVVVFLLDFLDLVDLCAMGLRYHPASRRKIAHPIQGMFQWIRELDRLPAPDSAQSYQLRFEDC